jgi:hypothetical protein
MGEECLIEKLQSRLAALEAQIAAVAPAVDAQPVAEVVKWQTFTGHTAWDLKVFDKTLEHGAKLYASAQSEGLRKDAERWRHCVEICHGLSDSRGEFVCVELPRLEGDFRSTDEMFIATIDAALSQHTGEKDD